MVTHSLTRSLALYLTSLLDPTFELSANTKDEDCIPYVVELQTDFHVLHRI